MAANPKWIRKTAKSHAKTMRLMKDSAPKSQVSKQQSKTTKLAGAGGGGFPSEKDYQQQMHIPRYGLNNSGETRRAREFHNARIDSSIQTFKDDNAESAADRKAWKAEQAAWKASQSNQ